MFPEYEVQCMSCSNSGTSVISLSFHPVAVVPSKLPIVFGFDVGLTSITDNQLVKCHNWG